MEVKANFPHEMFVFSSLPTRRFAFQRSDGSWPSDNSERSGLGAPPSPLHFQTTRTCALISRKLQGENLEALEFGRAFGFLKSRRVFFECHSAD